MESHTRNQSKKSQLYSCSLFLKTSHSEKYTVSYSFLSYYIGDDEFPRNPFSRAFFSPHLFSCPLVVVRFPALYQPRFAKQKINHFSSPSSLAVGDQRRQELLSGGLRGHLEYLDPGLRHPRGSDEVTNVRAADPSIDWLSLASDSTLQPSSVLVGLADRGLGPTSRTWEIGETCRSIGTRFGTSTPSSPAR